MSELLDQAVTAFAESVATGDFTLAERWLQIALTAAAARRPQQGASR